MDDSVRLQMRLAKKRYLNSKRVYEYERISLHVPKKFHETVKPYLEQDLDIEVTIEKGSLVVTLTPLENVARDSHVSQFSTINFKIDSEKGIRAGVNAT